jgi:hypothetical protein
VQGSQLTDSICICVLASAFITVVMELLLAKQFDLCIPSMDCFGKSVSMLSAMWEMQGCVL